MTDSAMKRTDHELTLQEVKTAIDKLSPEDRHELRDYLNQQDSESMDFKAGTMDIEKLLEAAKAIRESMNPKDFEEMIDAMNEEYIEPIGDDGFPL